VQKYTNIINPQNFFAFFSGKTSKIQFQIELIHKKNITFAPGLASRVLQCTPTELTLCHGGKAM